MRLATVLFACVATMAQADHRLTDRDIDAGATLYAEACASCHGAKLEGQPDWRTPGEDGILPAPPHDVTGHTWHHDTPLLLEYTLEGGQATLEARGVTGFKSGMPSFEETLTEDEVLDTLAFIRSTWPERAQEVQSQRTHAAD
ncbi:cytochrome c [Pseudooceanicola nitratireducens]|uniref:c-type cytochrome n=1 Tax=Pseudooceanicola nitratireducens TaxID=517719 RepID=UPI001C96D4FE|nr:c-type cytochrome [Pseudooceanicola nitratireducens]MBY6164872.1 cytochrome c [Pseudooceanicola nitratireducens]